MNSDKPADKQISEGCGYLIWGVVKFTGKFVAVVIILMLILMFAQWAYHAWWVSQHCTMILGTQVCQ